MGDSVQVLSQARRLIPRSLSRKPSAAAFRAACVASLVRAGEAASMPFEPERWQGTLAFAGSYYGNGILVGEYPPLDEPLEFRLRILKSGRARDEGRRHDARGLVGRRQQHPDLAERRGPQQIRRLGNRRAAPGLALARPARACGRESDLRADAS